MKHQEYNKPNVPHTVQLKLKHILQGAKFPQNKMYLQYASKKTSNLR